MILKGSQRASGGELATHLLNAFDNESVEIADLFGTVAEDLHGAFAEIEATALGTRCQEPLYSLSISPPFEIDRAAYFAAIDRIEKALNLERQPRAVVFHVKDGREHCHVVWSRIYADGERLKAVHMGHDHSRLMALSCEFFRELGFPLPEGLAAWEARQPGRYERPGLDYTLAEKAQSQASGVSVAERRAAITEAYRGSDSAEAFRAALALRGYTLAIGDKRGFVVLDESGEIFSLARQVEGAKTKDIKAKLAGIAGVPDVQKAKGILTARAHARADVQRGYVEAVINRERKELQQRQQHRALIQFIVRLKHERIEAEERLALKAKHKAEADAVNARRMKPVRRILASVPGLGALIRHYQAKTDLSLFGRQEKEREALRRKHALRAIMMDRADTFRERVERREDKAMSQHVRAKAALLAKRAQGGGRTLATSKDQHEDLRTLHHYKQAKERGKKPVRPFDDSKARKPTPTGRTELDDTALNRAAQAKASIIAKRAGRTGNMTRAEEAKLLDWYAKHRANAEDILREFSDDKARKPGESIGPMTCTAAAFMASLRDKPPPAPGTENQPPPDTPAKPDVKPLR